MKLTIESNDGDFSANVVSAIEGYNLDDYETQLNLLLSIQYAIRRAKDIGADESEEPLRYRVVLALHDIRGEHDIRYPTLTTDNEKEAKGLLAALLAEVDFRRSVIDALRPLDNSGDTRVQ
ncbi:MAG TPA: hypothetical protein VGW33_13785 [Terriglobia bacterium]|nr:hypothetical protein [Terriglobia bacterium]